MPAEQCCFFKFVKCRLISNMSQVSAKQCEKLLLFLKNQKIIKKKERKKD